jgi:hypothetical protein
VRPQEVLLLEEAIALVEHARADSPADGVVDVVADHRRGDEQRNHDRDVERTRAGERTRREQE